MGAPEALVIGVVALLVFGPKGLADIAKQLGATLRAFQPTIRELQEVSQEFKATLEDEIGLDEIRNPPPPVPRPQKRQEPSSVGAEAGGDAAAANEVTEEMKKAAADAAWGGEAPTPVPEPVVPAQTESSAAEEPAPAPEPAGGEVPSELSAPAAPAAEEKQPPSPSA